jgi:hypothetical protein
VRNRFLDVAKESGRGLGSLRLQASQDVQRGRSSEETERAGVRWSHLSRIARRTTCPTVDRLGRRDHTKGGRRVYANVDYYLQETGTSGADMAEAVGCSFVYLCFVRWGEVPDLALALRLTAHCHILVECL